MLNSRQNNYIEKLLSSPPYSTLFNTLTPPFIKVFFLERSTYSFFSSPCLPLFHYCMSQLIDLIYSREYETNTYLLFFFVPSSFFLTRRRKIKSNFSDVYAAPYFPFIFVFSRRCELNCFISKFEKRLLGRCSTNHPRFLCKRWRTRKYVGL